MTKLTITVLTVAMGLCAAPQAADKAEVAWKAALEKEVAEGDLKGAIAQYEKLARSGNRAVAARALVRMGQCYEKLGSAEAKKAYERALKEFADQQDSAAQARARLSAMGVAGSASAPRVVWGQASGQVWCASADGRWLSFPDRDTKNLVLRDLVAGTQRQLTHQSAPSTVGAEGSIVSPDGSRIAYLWVDREKPAGQRHTLRVIRSDGSGERVLATLGPQLWIQPLNWSPDGQWIAVRKGYAGGVGWRILLVSAEDGREREIVSREGLRGNIPEMVFVSPDGRWLAYSAPAVNRADGTGIFVVPTGGAAPPPVEVTTGAQLAGWSPKGDGLVVGRRQGTERMLALLPLAGGKPAGEPSKLASVAAADAYPLAITSRGSLLYLDSQQQREGLVAHFNAQANEIGKGVLSMATTDSGWVLIGGGVRFSPDGRKVFVTQPDGRVVIRSLEDGSQSEIQPRMKAFSRFEWAPDGMSLLVSGNGMDGRTGLYRIDLRTGEATLVKLDEGWAVSFASFAPARDGKSVYVRTPNEISSVSLENGEVRRGALPTTQLQFHQMAVSPDGKHLALFGNGGVDLVDITTRQIRELVRTPGSYIGGDWSPDGQYVFSTWTPGNWNSAQPSELVRLPVAGGAPMRTALGAHYINFRLSPDGKYAAMTRKSPVQHQILAIDNLFVAAARK